jgi:hypothetical protein
MGNTTSHTRPNERRNEHTHFDYVAKNRVYNLKYHQDIFHTRYTVSNRINPCINIADISNKIIMNKIKRQECERTWNLFDIRKQPI